MNKQLTITKKQIRMWDDIFKSFGCDFAIPGFWESDDVLQQAYLELTILSKKPNIIERINQLGGFESVRAVQYVGTIVRRKLVNYQMYLEASCRNYNITAFDPFSGEDESYYKDEWESTVEPKKDPEYYLNKKEFSKFIAEMINRISPEASILLKEILYPSPFDETCINHYKRFPKSLHNKRPVWLIAKIIGKPWSRWNVRVCMAEIRDAYLELSPSYL